jgi:hypothetical protein
MPAATYTTSKVKRNSSDHLRLSKFTRLSKLQACKLQTAYIQIPTKRDHIIHHRHYWNKKEGIPPDEQTAWNLNPKIHRKSPFSKNSTQSTISAIHIFSTRNYRIFSKFCKCSQKTRMMAMESPNRLTPTYKGHSVN